MFVDTASSENRSHHSQKKKQSSSKQFGAINSIITPSAALVGYYGDTPAQQTETVTTDKPRERAVSTALNLQLVILHYNLALIVRPTSVDVAIIYVRLLLLIGYQEANILRVATLVALTCSVNIYINMVSFQSSLGKFLKKDRKKHKKEQRASTVDIPPEYATSSAGYVHTIYIIPFHTY